jgi:aspartate 1-decarboxylase
MAAPKGSGRIELNGPPARHFQPGDKIIVLGEAYLDPSELGQLDAKVVIVESEDPTPILTDRNRKFRVLSHGELTNDG